MNETAQPEEPTIREATRADRDELLRLFQVGSLDPGTPELHDSPQDLREFVPEWLDNPSARLWVIDAHASDPPALAAPVG